ncbi:MAG: MCE family protein [Phycisphaeraceae bacterium]|nr:MCE family protein [Phycisphaeraceae bacterium]
MSDEVHATRASSETAPDAPRPITPPSRPPDALPVAELRPAGGLSPVWIIPLLALLIAAALVLRDWLSQGPRFEVVVASADGLEAGRTPVKSGGVVIGRVVEVTLLPDGLRPMAVIEIQPWARTLLHADARFWIERPEISLQGIRGLGTLASGPFIVCQPGQKGAAPRRFEALARPPVADEPGLIVQLRAPRLKALRRGSPILFRDMPIGQVVDLQLSTDARSAIVTARIEPRFATLVRERSRFWNASGFSLDLGITGLSTQVESVESVLVGGIGFATPDPPGAQAESGAIFDLADKVDPRWLNWAPAIPLP